MEQQTTSIPEQSLAFITKSSSVTRFILHSFNNWTYNRIILLFNLPIIFSSLVNNNLCGSANYFGRIKVVFRPICRWDSSHNGLYCRCVDQGMTISRDSTKSVCFNIGLTRFVKYPEIIVCQRSNPSLTSGIQLGRSENICVVRRRGRLAPRQPLSVCALLPAYEGNRHLRPLGNLGHRLRQPRWID